MKGSASSFLIIVLLKSVQNTRTAKYFHISASQKYRTTVSMTEKRVSTLRTKDDYFTYWQWRAFIPPYQQRPEEWSAGRWFSFVRFRSVASSPSTTARTLCSQTLFFQQMQTNVYLSNWYFVYFHAIIADY